MCNNFFFSLFYKVAARSNIFLFPLLQPDQLYSVTKIPWMAGPHYINIQVFIWLCIYFPCWKKGSESFYFVCSRCKVSVCWGGERRCCCVYIFYFRLQLLNTDWRGEMILPGYQTSNSMSSSKFQHLALLALLVELVSHSINFHHLPCLVVLVLH